ncbi:family 16 glycosylhydrolase [Fluviicola sp.]|uniref:family 16 glycosylhydrolase n=1 Tax=Fluviicola sp. TaxID=1917219 RepID=UPI003D29E2F7
MRKILLIFGFIPAVSFGQLWNLVWSDEFSDNLLNSAKWQSEIGTGSSGWGNNELQYYTASPNNLYLDTGYLHIKALEQPYNGSDYTSSRIKTQGLYDFEYGKVEARMKLPSGKGIWSAFWMLGSNITTLGWPACGEIDIMERVNTELKVHGTYHHDNSGHTYEGDFQYVDPSVFHVYGVEWDANEMRWYVDGVEYFSKNIGSGSISTEEFHGAFFILFNVAIGGNWPGNPDANTIFPATMIVDYVRVYKPTALQLNELSTSHLILSPNPAQKELLVKSETPIESYVIYSITGSEIQRGSETSISIGHLPAGTYMIEVEGENNQIFREKFIHD